MINFLESFKDEAKIMEIGLHFLATLQSSISAMVPGAITVEVTNEQITNTCFALTCEVFELAQELGWKNWKANPEMTNEQKEVIAEEFADILAFLGLLLFLIYKRTGLNSEQLVDAYFKKSQKNIERFLGTSGEANYLGFGV